MKTKKSARSLGAMGAGKKIVDGYPKNTPFGPACQTTGNISTFNGIKPLPIGVTTWQEALEDIRSDKYKKVIARVRVIYRNFGWGSPEYREIKIKLPAVTFSGRFNYRNTDLENLVSSTGFITADLDHVTNLKVLFKLLIQDKYIWFVFKSPSAEGIKCGIRAQNIKNNDSHKQFYFAVEQYFKEIYGIKIDPACKDISRLTFVSHDPELWINPEPYYFDISKWSKPLEPPQPVIPSPNFKNSVGKEKYARIVLESCCEEIRQSQPGNQHHTRLRMSRLIGGYLRYIDENEVVTALERAVRDSGAKRLSPAMKTVRDGLEYGKLEPITIEDLHRSSASHSGLNSTGQSQTQDEAKKPAIPSLLPVPVDAFPDDIQTVINSLAKAHGTTFEVAVMAVLAVSGSLIGWSRRLIVKEGWCVHASLYAAISAETGEGKSPTTDFLLKPVEELERQKFLEYEAAMEEYEMKLREWQAEKKELRGNPPELPLRKRYKMGDCTIEAMADALDGNPKGLLWYRDELNGLFLDLDKYTGKEGSTKTKLIEAYDLKPWQIDRVNKDRTTYIPKACLGVFGTIQPKILFQAFDDLDAASGFLPRFIIIHSAKTGPTLWSDAGTSDSLSETWSRYVQALASYELELADDKDAKTVFLKSRLVGLKEDAKSEYIAWYNRIAVQPWNNVADGLFKAIVPKMQEQALRICLILHCLESIAFGRSETLPVQVDTMRRALRLADWVWTHQKRMWSLLNKNTAAGHAPLEQRIAAAIIALEPEIENSILLTKRITEKLNEGLEKKYHIKPESVGHTCARKLKLQNGPDKNNRGWIITPDIIDHLKSVYGLTAKITARTARTAQNPHPQANTDGGSSFTTARNAQENTGSFFNRPTTDRTLNPHQSGKKGSMGSSGGYLPEISNNPNIANQPDIFDNPPGDPEWQESLKALTGKEAPTEDDQDREIFEP